MTVTREPVAIPDSTGPTLALLRGLRQGRGRRQAASIAFWVYAALFVVAVYGGSLIAAAYRALRHPPPVTAQALRVLHAAPAALAAAALLVLLLLIRDALWRGPVIVPQATADWLLDTPVDRGRLLRPRFRLHAAGLVAAGAAAGIMPAAALVALGLGGRNAGDVLRLGGAAMASTALLFAFGAGCAGLIERYPATWRWVRAGTPVVIGAAAVLGGLAAWAALGWPALGRPPPVVSAVALWSGPWGWAESWTVALASRAVPGSGPPGSAAAGSAAAGSAAAWPAAVALLAVAAAAALAIADRVAATVPATALRSRAATLGVMSAAAFTGNTRSIANAYRAAAGARRARFRLPPPRSRWLVLPWRDVLALLRAPARLIAAVILALAAVGLLAVAAQARPVSLPLVAGALAMGYLAAAWLCEGARLDADDPRRSVPLPFRYESLTWWHAIVPAGVLLVAAGVPALLACLAAGDPRRLALLAVTVPVLTAGALLNVFRAPFSPDLFYGFDTPLGNTAAINIVVWAAWGPVLSIGPMTLLVSGALGSAGPGPLARAVVIGAALAAGLGVYASRRAARLRAG